MRLIGADRCWLAGHRSAPALPGLPENHILRVFSESPYDLSERDRRGPVGRLLQTLVYRDVAFVPRQMRAWFQRLRQGQRRQGAATPCSPLVRPGSAYCAELAGVIDHLAMGSNDHVVFTSLDAEMGRAVLELIARRGAAALPMLHLRLMYDAETRTDAALDYGGLVERLVATRQIGRRLHLYCETAAHARALRERTGEDAAIAPYPAAPLPERGGHRGRFVVGYFGEARREKGFHHLDEIVEAFGARHPDLQDKVAWRFQAGGRSVEAAGQRDAVRARHRPSRADVRYRFGALSIDDYEAFRASVDIVLAPQSPDVYALRGSGVSQEAAAGGRPLVCFAGTSLADNQDAAVATGRTVADLADAVATILRSPEPWFERARLGAEKFERRLESSPLFSRVAQPPPESGASPLALVVGRASSSAASRRAACGDLDSRGFQIVSIHLIETDEDRSAVLARVWRGPERERQAFLSLVLDEQRDVNLQDLLAWQHVSEVKTLDAPGRAFLKNVALSGTVTIDGHEKLTADAREDGSRPAESRV